MNKDKWFFSGYKIAHVQIGRWIRQRHMKKVKDSGKQVVERKMTMISLDLWYLQHASLQSRQLGCRHGQPSQGNTPSCQRFVDRRWLSESMSIDVLSRRDNQRFPERVEEWTTKLTSLVLTNCAAKPTVKLHRWSENHKVMFEEEHSCIENRVGKWKGVEDTRERAATESWVLERWWMKSRCEHWIIEPRA